MTTLSTIHGASSKYTPIKQGPVNKPEAKKSKTVRVACVSLVVPTLLSLARKFVKTVSNISLSNHIENLKKENGDSKILFPVSEKTSQDCLEMGLKLTLKQLKVISGLVREVFLSGAEFTNVKRAKFIDFPKMHIFFKKAENIVEVYLKGDIHQPVIVGGKKNFSQRFSLIFSPYEQPQIIRVACLRGILKKVEQSKNLTQDVDPWASLNKEIFLLKKLKGKPHVCQLRNHAIYEGSTGNGHDKKLIQKFVIYEDLCDGDLSVIEKKYPEKFKDKEFIMKIFEGSLNSLAILHENGIIHKDIKQLNIFMNIKDEGIFIGDFDLSQLYSDPPMDQVWGTLAFIAPETIFNFELKRDLSNEMGIKPGFYGFSVDIWALGVLLYVVYAKFTNSRSIHGFPPFNLAIVLKRMNWPNLKNGDAADQSINHQWNKIKKVMADIDTNPFPISDPIAALLWHMLRPNPQERITIKEAQVFFQEHIINKKPLQIPVRGSSIEENARTPTQVNTSAINGTKEPTMSEVKAPKADGQQAQSINQTDVKINVPSPSINIETKPIKETWWKYIAQLVANLFSILFWPFRRLASAIFSTQLEKKRTLQDF